MDRNEGAKRCCIPLGCGLRSDTLKNPYMDPDQLTTPHTARLPTTSTTATAYIDDSIHHEHPDSPDPSVPTTSLVPNPSIHIWLEPGRNTQLYHTMNNYQPAGLNPDLISIPVRHDDAGPQPHDTSGHLVRGAWRQHDTATNKTLNKGRTFPERTGYVHTI